MVPPACANDRLALPLAASAFIMPKYACEQALSVNPVTRLQCGVFRAGTPHWVSKLSPVQRTIMKQNQLDIYENLYNRVRNSIGVLATNLDSKSLRKPVFLLLPHWHVAVELLLRGYRGLAYTNQPPIMRSHMVQMNRQPWLMLTL